METDATRMCALLVGLPDVNVLAVEDDDPLESLRVHVETTVADAGCGECGTRATSKDRSQVALVDLPAFGRPAVLVWHKRRWRCPDPDCDVGSFTEIDARIAAPRARVTDRAGRWVTAQVGRDGRSVAEVARELGCDWHTVMDAVTAYGTPLIDDPTRIGEVTALGLDETLFARLGAKRTRSWCTSIVDVNRPAQLLDVVQGRSSAAPSDWLNRRPSAWRAAIRWGVLDLSGPYRKTFNDTLPHATQVADPFHVVKVGNTKVDECRRRVQNDTLGHRGRKDDPLYRSRRLLTKGADRLDDTGTDKLLGFLEAGDPKGEVRMTWHAKETLRGVYNRDDLAEATVWLDELIDDCADEDFPPEVNSLGRTLARWRDQILAWHQAKVSNGPTEATNNLIKRIKRIGFGFRRFAHYRTRVLLYCGAPNWERLATVTPRPSPKRRYLNCGSSVLSGASVGSIESWVKLASLPTCGNVAAVAGTNNLYLRVVNGKPEFEVHTSTGVVAVPAASPIAVSGEDVGDTFGEDGFGARVLAGVSWCSLGGPLMSDPVFFST